MMAADHFARLLRLAMGSTHRLTREPTPAECPNWCALKMLDDAGHPVSDTDPLLEISFWEFAAFAAEQTFGRTMAATFARLCRAYADAVLADITTEETAA